MRRRASCGGRARSADWPAREAPDFGGLPPPAWRRRSAAPENPKAPKNVSARRRFAAFMWSISRCGRRCCDRDGARARDSPARLIETPARNMVKLFEGLRDCFGKSNENKVFLAITAR